MLDNAQQTPGTEAFDKLPSLPDKPSRASATAPSAASYYANSQFPNVYIFEPQISDLKRSTIDRSIFLSNEFSKSETTAEIRDILLKCGAKIVEIVPLSIENCKEQVKRLVDLSNNGGDAFVVFNLCDGTEIDGYPGLNAVHELERAEIAFTGSNSKFYLDTTSKPNLKRKLQSANVPTSPFTEIRKGFELQDITTAESHLTYPMIIKPSISYASLSITNSSVVHNREEAVSQAISILPSHPDGIFVEAFMGGREFTVLVLGDAKNGVQVYPAAERVFNKKLGKFERLLAFDQYWDGYELGHDAPDMNESAFYWYEMAPEQWQSELADVARRAYIAQGGNGYGRVDIRTRDNESLEGLAVLEVNANCGLSFLPGSSTTAEILRMNCKSSADFLGDVIGYSERRRRNKSVPVSK